MKNNDKMPELATFTFLNPDFHVSEEENQREMSNEKSENRYNAADNEE
ncbi:hypothetical protein [Virgibacillus indicus]|nr:hypothetical protein [Virgibacillus indicus]